MGYQVFLLFSLGVLVTTSSSKCVPETEECSRYWVKLEPHKNLMESENELNSWCRKQMLFYKCLEDGLLRSGNSSDLPINFLISKMFSEDLCTDDSRGRKRYLNNAVCINQLDTEYCTLPEYLDIVTPDDAIPSRCSLSDQTFSCIAATIVSNCGFDAGRVYRYLLKVISYSTEVCEIEGSESLPPCEDEKQNAPKREEELSEIYYGLINRFGVIPEQTAEQDDFSVVSDEVESPVTDMDESLISEAIRNALDNIHEDSSPEVYETILLSDQPENPRQDTADSIQYDFKNQDSSYKRTPIITEPFKGLLHYNYSGQEYAIYWRQPDDFAIENVECEHLLPSFLKGVIFRCLLYRRLRDPDCVYSVEDEPMSPKLIRDIDPDVPHDSVVDFGPRPYWMEELDEYKRQRDLREMSSGKFSASDVGSETEPSRPIAYTTDTLHEMAHNPNFKWWKCLNVFSEELRNDIASVLLPGITEYDTPLMSAHYSNNVAYVFLYEARLHDLENIFCERVNECHPKGKGVFKCSFKPREMKQCHNCYEESTSPSPAFDNLRNLKTAPENLELSSEVTDSSNVESSGDSDYETSSDSLITLLLSRDAPPVSDEAGDEYTEDIMAEEDELVAIDISNDIPEQSQGDAPSGLSFVILDQDVKLPDDVSEISSDNLQKADGLDDHESDSTYNLSPDDEYKLMRENVLLLQAIKPNVDIRAVYEIETSEKKEPFQDVEKGNKNYS